MEPNEHARFLSEETLTALFKGRLDRETRRSMIEHMATCSACYALAAEKSTQYPPRSRPLVPIATAVILALALLAGPVAYQQWTQSESHRVEIIGKASPPARFVDGRITGFPYRPYRATTRSIQSAAPGEHSRAVVATNRVRTAFTGSASDLRVVGVSYLARGRENDAVEILERAVRAASGGDDVLQAIETCENTPLLSDLSVAYVARGKSVARPSDFVSALDVAMRAWELRPSPETAWNRAIAFETLHQNEDALEAWQDYLEIDSASPWAVEARQRMRQVNVPSQSDRWTRESAGLKTMSSAEVNRLAGRFPQQLRELGEGPLLQQWSSAVLTDDAGEAEDALRQLEVIATGLQQHSGESLLADIVATIQTTSSPPETRALATAIRAYGEAKALYDGDGGSRARVAFLQAAEALRRHDCALAYAATFYAAASRYFENDYEGLASDVARITDLPARYMSLHARAQWVTGLGQLARGRPDDAIAHYEAALKGFSLLGETDYEAAAYSLLSEAYVYVDSPEQAWLAWMDAVETVERVGSSSQRTMQVMLRGAKLALAENHPAVATIFLNRAMKRAIANPDRAFVIETILGQATVAHHRRDLDDYRRLIALAQANAARIPDAKLRERELNSIRVTRAICGDEAVAPSDLEQSLKFLRTSSNRFSLPELLYLRGKLAGAGASSYGDAMRSYADGLDEIIRQRQAAITPRYDTLGRQHLDEITQSAVALAVEHRDFLNAFRISEASAGADLPWRVSAIAKIPRGVAIIKCLTLSDRVVVWLLTDSATKVIARSISREAVEDAVASLHADPTAASPAAKLGRLLLTPFLSSLEDVTSIVFVPDSVFASVPFGALTHPRTNRTLLNDFAIAQVPTVAAFLGAAAVDAPRSAAATFVDGSRAGTLPPLPQAAAEIRKLRPLYERARIWSEPEQRGGAIESALRPAGLIHIAAHGVINRSNPLLSGIVLGTRGEFLYAHEIAALDLRDRPIVVLSSCSGSSSSSVRGRRGLSLADAFLAAGAAVVVASSEEVRDDDARAFSLLLHDGLQKGLAVGEAVRRAQSALRGEGASWAGFHVIGNPATRLAGITKGDGVDA